MEIKEIRDSNLSVGEMTKEGKEKLRLEKENGLVKDFNHHLEQLNLKPGQITQLKEFIELTEEEGQVNIEYLGLSKVDLELRKENFRIINPKFAWENDPKWMDNQKEIIGLELKKIDIEVSKKRKEMSMSLNNTRKALATTEKQVEICQKNHKIALKQLVKECGWGDGKYAGLKKTCNHPCCR